MTPGSRNWALAIYLVVTNLNGVSSMKLRRDLGVSQRTAWFVLHPIREAWMQEPDTAFAGPVEVDKMYVGGKAKNTHAWRLGASWRRERQSAPRVVRRVGRLAFGVESHSPPAEPE